MTNILILGAHGRIDRVATDLLLKQTDPRTHCLLRRLHWTEIFSVKINRLLENEGTLKAAQRIADHADSRTKKLMTEWPEGFARRHGAD
jgi:hypothetical protein